MSDDIKNEATKQMLGWLKEAADVTRDQAPKACHDVLTAGMIQSGISLGVGLAAVVLSGYFVVKTFAYAKRSDNGKEGEWFLFVVSIVPLIISIAIVGINAYWLLVCVYAPRAYLLDVLGVIK